MSSATLKTITLGCKVNQYETEYVREGLFGIGYRDAARDEPADLCIVNTCTVTARGDAKSRQAVRRLARENPGARIVVMGCYATRAPEQLLALPGVTDVVTDKRKLPELLERLGVARPPTGISAFGSRHRAYVKVQDGCLLRCSYCIIPRVRPPLSSRPPGAILDEVRRLVDHGYRELVLTGIHLGHYGVDRNRGKPKKDWVRLANLVRRIAEIDGPLRIRLSSIEATEVTRELLDVMARLPEKICPHLHIPMQSGSDSVLRRMNRRWGVRRLIDRCRLVQEMLDTPALTTDVLVGFPGETEEEFRQTCRALRRIGFSKAHIFPFSPREGTPAADMPDQVPHRIKTERARRLARIERELRRAYLGRLVGRRLRVLVQSPVSDRAGFVAGTSCRYVPVRFRGSEKLCGQIVEVTASEVTDDHILAAR